MKKNSSRVYLFQSGMKISIAFFFCLWLSPIQASFGNSSTDAHLTENVIISFSGHAVALAKGTLVSVLKRKEDLAVVSLFLPDGSPFVTQIPVRSLAFSTDKLISTSPVNKSVAGAAPSGPSPPEALTSKVSVSAPSPLVADATGTTIVAGSLLTQDTGAPVHPDFSSKLATLAAVAPVKKYGCLQGYFYIVVNGDPVPVVYSLPTENDHIVQSASNVIFYGPHPGGQIPLTATFSDVVENMGYTVFSLSINTREMHLHEDARSYYNAKAGWCEALLTARDALIKRYGLEKKKLILYGFSGGGGMVLNFAGAYPQEVEAVATEGANVCPEIKERNSVKWLITNTRGETNAEVTVPFYDKLIALGCTAFYSETPSDRGRGNYHGPTKESGDLIDSFIAAAVNQRDLIAEGTTDIRSLWPYASPKDALKRCMIVKTSDLSDDEINGKTYDLLPSGAFALAWSKVCPPPQTVSSVDGGTPLHLSFPSIEKPLGTIIYYDYPTYKNIARIVEDVNSLAEHGFIVVSPSGIPNAAIFAHAAAQWVKSQSGSYFKNGVHLLGFGAAGADFISAMADDGTDLSVKSINFVDYDDCQIGEDIKAKCETMAKQCGLYGLCAYSTSKENTGLTQIADDLVTQAAQDRGCYYQFIERKLTMESVELDGTKALQDKESIKADSDRIALDNDKLLAVGKWDSPEDQDEAHSDAEKLEWDKTQARADRDQLDRDKSAGDLDRRNVEERALDMIRDLAIRYSKS